MQGYQHQCGSAKCYHTATVTSVTTWTTECTLFARHITTHQLLHVSVGTGPSSVAHSCTQQMLKAVCPYLLTMCGQKHAAAGMTVTKLCVFVGSKCNVRNGDVQLSLLYISHLQQSIYVNTKKQLNVTFDSLSPLCLKRLPRIWCNESRVIKKHGAG